MWWQIWQRLHLCWLILAMTQRETHLIMVRVSSLLAHFSHMFNYLFSGKPDKFVVDNTNDIKQHDRDWEEIGNCKKKIICPNVAKVFLQISKFICPEFCCCFDLFLLQLKGWKAWVRKILPQEERKTRSRILTSERNQENTKSRILTSEENTTGWCSGASLT